MWNLMLDGKCVPIINAFILKLIVIKGKQDHDNGKQMNALS